MEHTKEFKELQETVKLISKQIKNLQKKVKELEGRLNNNNN